MLRGWLLVLAAYLLIWMPLTLSRELAVTLPSIGMRGWGAVLELTAHALVAALTVAAGWALAVRNPRAPMFGIVALAGSAAAMVQSLYWSALPRQTLPDDRIILAGAAIVHAAAWIAYLRRSRRVRALYD